MSNRLTIVFPDSIGGKATPTRGTKVFTPDGVPIGGVQRIELVAEAGDLWRARIECLAVIEGSVVAEVSGPAGDSGMEKEPRAEVVAPSDEAGGG